MLEGTVTNKRLVNELHHKFLQTLLRLYKKLLATADEKERRTLQVHVSERQLSTCPVSNLQKRKKKNVRL